MKKSLKNSITIFSIISFFVLFIISTYFILIINNTKDINIAKLSPSNTSILYDDKGDKITEIGNNLNKFVSYDNISKNMINAIISVEDNNYFNHSGINFKRMLGATMKNIKSRSFKEGASTIEQQLIKNVYLTNEKSINRKISEVSIALKLNRNLTKEQILEAYLNSILFSRNIYGIEAASNYFFNVSANELSISQAATLAGMVQLPNYYNPFKNLRESQERRDLVLHLMHKNNFITKQDLNHHLKTNIKDTLYYESNQTDNKLYYASYLDYTYSYLKENELFISGQNSDVFTYMNKEIQEDLFDIINNQHNHFPDDKIKCSIVVLDNNTGGVIGLVGNKNTDQKVLNYATTKLQPGSTIKPILDYAPAIEYLNYGPSTIIVDEPYSYSNGFKIKNWDNKYEGHITLRRALEDSRNVPALKLFQKVGQEKALSFAKRLNIYNSDTIYESEALGGSTNGYSLLELTNAYSAFANMGQFIKASGVKSINYNESKYINSNQKKLVMKPSTAFMINSMLHDVYKGSSFDLKNTFLCAKTGQTNYSKETCLKYDIPLNATKDSLLVAYTPDLTIGIWVGYDVISKDTYLNDSKCLINRSIMKYILSKYAKNNLSYPLPKNVTTRRIIKDSNNIYLADEKNYNKSYLEYFIKGTEPLNSSSSNNHYEI